MNYKQTGTRPKVKLTSPKLFRASNVGVKRTEFSFEEVRIDSQSLTDRQKPRGVSSLKISPLKKCQRRCKSSEDRDNPGKDNQESNFSPLFRKSLPKGFANNGFEDTSSSLHHLAMGYSSKSDDKYCQEEMRDMSFLEFETKYNMEKEMLLSRYELCNEYDGCGGLTPTRMGVYTELPDPCRNFDMSNGRSALQHPAEGFSFAPGWALNAEHFYQWQQRGKTTKEVYLLIYFSLRIFLFSIFSS